MTVLPVMSLCSPLELDGAMALFQEQERICRDLGVVGGLIASLVGQARLLLTMGRARQALPLAEDAYECARRHGLAPLARQVEPILDEARSQTR